MWARVSRGRLFPSALVALAALGCAPAFQNRVPGLVVVPARMIVLPPMVHDLEIAAGGEAVPREQAAEAIRAGVDGVLARFATLHGARVLEPDETAGLPAATRETLSSLYRWAGVSVGSVTAQKTGRASYHRTSVVDWRSPDDFTPLARVLRADTALFVAISDRHETLRRRAVGSLEGNRELWRTLCAACLIDLGSGQLVWCDAEVDAWNDLDDPAVAAAAVDALLARLDVPGPTGATK